MVWASQANKGMVSFVPNGKRNRALRSLTDEANAHQFPQFALSSPLKSVGFPAHIVKALSISPNIRESCQHLNNCRFDLKLC